MNGREFHIILDVVFQDNPYSDLVTRKIDNEFLALDGTDSLVKLPSANCIIGDKLTAFAPNTTGIKFDKPLEIVKQLYDVASLLDIVDNFSVVKDTYRNIAKTELHYRGLNGLSYTDSLNDSIHAAKCIISKGRIDLDNHKHYIQGIRNIKNHIFSEAYSENIAIFQACKALHLAASMLTDQGELMKPQFSETVASLDGKHLSYVKKLNEEANAYLVEGLNLLRVIDLNR